jgi:CheY-like chemotaxis protein
MPPVTAQRRRASGLEGLRVLVVEDEPLVAVDYRFLLMELGAVPLGYKATNAAALEFLRANEVDVAIVDYRLRDGSSEPVMQWLREHDIPFLVVTANTPEMHAETGAGAILDKPATPAMLEAALVELSR